MFQFESSLICFGEIPMEHSKWKQNYPKLLPVTTCLLWFFPLLYLSLTTWSFSFHIEKVARSGRSSKEQCNWQLWGVNEVHSSWMNGCVLIQYFFSHSIFSKITHSSPTKVILFPGGIFFYIFSVSSFTGSDHLPNICSTQPSFLMFMPILVFFVKIVTHSAFPWEVLHLPSWFFFSGNCLMLCSSCDFGAN